ncbi:MAG: hypothetical protein E7032_07520 [Akkermansiaceae bacterium]|nr:hypothetical protein [Akkermansiaceae bacterium]
MISSARVSGRISFYVLPTAGRSHYPSPSSLPNHWETINHALQENDIRFTDDILPAARRYPAPPDDILPLVGHGKSAFPKPGKALSENQNLVDNDFSAC